MKLSSLFVVVDMCEMNVVDCCGWRLGNAGSWIVADSERIGDHFLLASQLLLLDSVAVGQEEQRRPEHGRLGQQSRHLAVHGRHLVGPKPDRIGGYYRVRCPCQQINNLPFSKQIRIIYLENRQLEFNSSLTRQR